MGQGAGNTYPIYDDANAILDNGVVHWLAALLPPDTEAALDDSLGSAEQVLTNELGSYWPRGFDEYARRAVSRIFEVLVDAGVVEWINPETVSTSFDSYPRGGIVRLTALGRYVLPDDLLDAGYLLRRRPCRRSRVRSHRRPRLCAR